MAMVTMAADPYLLLVLVVTIQRIFYRVAGLLRALLRLVRSSFSDILCLIRCHFRTFGGSLRSSLRTPANALAEVLCAGNNFTMFQVCTCFFSALRYFLAAFL